MIHQALLSLSPSSLQGSAQPRPHPEFREFAQLLPPGSRQECMCVWGGGCLGRSRG